MIEFIAGLLGGMIGSVGGLYVAYLYLKKNLPKIAYESLEELLIVGKLQHEI